MKTLVAIDPGTWQAGLAVFVGNKPVWRGLINVRGHGPMRTDQRITYVVEAVKRLTSGITVDEVATERPMGFDGRPAPELLTLITALRQWARHRKAQYFEYHPSTVRSVNTLRGVRWSETKGETSRMLVRQLYGLNIKDHNVSDALLIGRCHIIKTEARQLEMSAR